MTETCCTSGNDVMILACSGGSNVGQLSNQAAIELTQEGFGKMFCLAGIGGRLSGFVQSARDVPFMVAIDGCPTGCAKAILEQARVPLNHYLVITEEGIEKNKNFNLERVDIECVKAAVKRLFQEPQPAFTKPVIGCGCGKMIC
ncbi:MAG: putative zinc-binding protein [Thermodesulfobacteriota bacterium]